MIAENIEGNKAKYMQPKYRVLTNPMADLSTALKKCAISIDSKKYKSRHYL